MIKQNNYNANIALTGVFVVGNSNPELNSDSVSDEKSRSILNV